MSGGSARDHRALTPEDDGGPRLVGETEAKADQENTASTTVRETCEACARRPAVPGWHHCSNCLRDFVDGLRRRRAAELRMQPLCDLRSAS